MRAYPQIYSQRDPQWASSQLGGVSGATIGAYGCILTCHAMKSGYYGHQIQPNALNDIYNQRKLYISGDLLSDADLSAVFPDIQLTDTKVYTSIPADLVYLKQLASDPTLTVTIEVDFDHDPNDGIQTHFVELHDFDGTKLTIYDPWYGSDDDFTLHYGTNLAQTIQKIAIYKGTPITDDPLVCDKKSVRDMLVTKASANNAVCDELSLGHDVGKDTEITAIAKIKADKATAEQTITTLNQQLPGLKTDNDQLTGQVATLKSQLQDAQNAQREPISGLLYKDLYNQSQTTIVELRSKFSDAQTTNNKQMAQYQNTSLMLLPPGQVLWVGIARFLHLPLQIKSGKG